MLTTRFILACFVILLHFACNNGSGKKDEGGTTYKAKAETRSLGVKSAKQSLEGQIFLFAPELDSRDCSASGACDCCSYNILFISDDKFILVDYCESNFSYSKGSYMLNDSSLTLIAGNLIVNKAYNPANETDTAVKTNPDYRYNIETIPSSTTVLQRDECNGTMIFKGKMDVGAIDKKHSFEKIVQAMKAEGIWAKLRL